jgi:hypothetical protein
LILQSIQDNVELKDGVRGESYSGPIKSEFTLDPAANNLISSLESSLDGKIVTKQSWKFKANSSGVVVPKSFAIVSETGRGGCTDQELKFSSFSLGSNGFAFAFADLDVCDSCRMINQSTGNGIEYVRLTESPAPNQSIRQSFEGSK